MTLTEIAYVVVSSLLGSDVEHTVLKCIVDDTFAFDIPVKRLREGLDVFELFTGPTMAFKDFSARFVANFIRHFDENAGRRVAIAATTGNTGGAVANAFAAYTHHPVVVLYPRGVLTREQIDTFATAGKTVFAVEVGGDIAACKDMVWKAMGDADLTDVINLTCVNTSNFLRLIPQVVFFFYAYSRLKGTYGNAEEFSPVIPSGNLSSLTSAVIAKRLGLPMGKIIAGINANDSLVKLLRGEIESADVSLTARRTLAPAMDSGYPTNLARLLALYGSDIARINKDVSAYSVSDEEIRNVIEKEVVTSGYILDPHTAVALGALEKHGYDGNSHYALLATAHPAKSREIVESVLGRPLSLHESPEPRSKAKRNLHKIPPTYPALKKFLLQTIK